MIDEITLDKDRDYFLAYKESVKHHVYSCKVFGADVKRLEEALFSLKEALFSLEAERISAQLSGFETGFEHPNTMVLYDRVMKISKLIDQETK